MSILKTIKGVSIKSQILSIDGILTSILKKVGMVQDKINKRNIQPISFHISSYVPSCNSGGIVYAYLFLVRIDLKKVVIVLDKIPEDVVVSVLIDIITDKGIKTSVGTDIREGVNSIDDARKIQPGDKISIKILYSGPIGPTGIWTALRGEQV